MVELSSGEKQFIQRILAEQCMTKARAQEFWSRLAQKGKIEADNLDESLKKCNTQLQLAGMAIVGIPFSLPSPKDDDNDEENANAPPTMYLALVDKHRPAMGDDEAPSATKIAFVKSSLGGPIAVNHRRAVLQHLVEHTTASRADLINLKNTLKDNSNYTLDMAETCVNSMFRDHWIVSVSGGGKRRQSMHAKAALGPRTFLELWDLLLDQFDMDRDQLPQQIFY